MVGSRGLWLVGGELYIMTYVAVYKFLLRAWLFFQWERMGMTFPQFQCILYGFCMGMQYEGDNAFLNLKCVPSARKITGYGYNLFSSFRHALVNG